MQRRSTAQNGAARIVSEIFEPPGASELVVMVPSFARGAGDFMAAFGSDLAVRVADAGYKVALPWPRQFAGGPSTGTLEGLSLEDMASDLAAVIEAEGGGRPARILGHAYGQRIARMLATIEPGKVERLIMAAAGGIKPTPPAPLAAIGVLALSEGATHEQRLHALETAFFAPGNDPAIWLEGWDRDLGVAQTAANRQDLVSHWWAGGGVVPMYVLQADCDTTSPAEDSSALLKKDFPDRVEVVTIANAGHAMLPEQPEAIATAVLDFLAR